MRGELGKQRNPSCHPFHAVNYPISGLQPVAQTRFAWRTVDHVANHSRYPPAGSREADGRGRSNSCQMGERRTRAGAKAFQHCGKSSRAMIVLLRSHGLHGNAELLNGGGIVLAARAILRGFTPFSAA